MKFLIVLAIIGFVAAAPVSKEDLLKRATDLEARLTAAEAKVKTSKPAEARLIEAEIKNLKTIAKELEAASEAAVVARLETRLASVEKSSEATLKRIEGQAGTTAGTTAASFEVAAPTKEELLKRATDLEARLTAAEAKVKTTHPAEVRVIESELKNLQALSKELTAATEAAVVARLETRLVSAERTAEATLRRIEGGRGTTAAPTEATTAAFVGAPTKEELLKRATDLEARLTAAEAKVKTSKPAEARMIEAEIKSLKTLSTELTAATEAAVVARLETRLTSVERTAEAILRRIEGGPGTTAATTAASFVGAPTKEELIKKATDLEAQLQADVDKVKSTHPQEARILETEIRELKSLAGELGTATNEQVVAHLSQRLAGVERRAEETLKRIDGRGGPTTAASFEVAAPTKEELEKKATDLETQLQAEVDKVRTTHPMEVRILETEIRELKLLAGELATAKNAQVIAHLETRLAGVERRAAEIIARIGGRTRGPTTEAPVTDASTASAAY
jgi:hypothetical protein